MEYRKLPHGGEDIGVIGFGTSYIGRADEKEIEATIALALEMGINYIDLASADARPFPCFGRVVGGAREKVHYQIHFGAIYKDGPYARDYNLEAVKRSIDWQLEQLRTDYIDVGFIHCVDEQAELEELLSGGVIDHIKALKRQGVVRHIGLSTHTPAIAHRVLDLGLPDVLMFSLNPAYDYRQDGDYSDGTLDERHELYRRCEALGVGISVMKTYAGGQLLDEKTSPFHRALTPYQCIQYALDRPGVMTVLPGFRDREDVRRTLGFFEAEAAERDYSVIGSLTPEDTRGRCVYCNHCQALPGGAGDRTDQQILRPGPPRRRPGPGPLPAPVQDGGGLRRLRPLQPALPVPGGPDGPHGGDPRLLWPLNRRLYQNQTERNFSNEPEDIQTDHLRPVHRPRAGAALPHRADPPDRQHAAADAHPGVPLRADLRLAVRPRRRLYRAAAALGAVHDASLLPDGDLDGL